METFIGKIDEFQHKYWHFTIMEIDDSHCRIFVRSNATAHKMNISWLANRSVAENHEKCVEMLKNQIQAELEYTPT